MKMIKDKPCQTIAKTIRKTYQDFQLFTISNLKVELVL